VSDKTALGKDLLAKGNFNMESLEAFTCMQFMGGAQKKKRQFGKAKLPLGVLDDYDEGEPFVETLDFKKMDDPGSETPENKNAI
jgi:hypothetical protein